MERRLILAIALSLLILLSWSALASKLYHIDAKGVATQSPTVIRPGSAPLPGAVASHSSMESASMAPTSIEPEALAPLVSFTSDKLEVTFIESLAAIKEVKFKHYQGYQFPLKYGLALVDKSLKFRKESSSSDAVTFVHSGPNQRITKKFTFSNSNYTIGLEIKIQNLSAAALSVNLPLVLGVLDFSSRDVNARYQDVTVAVPEKVWHIPGRKEMTFAGVKFLGLRDRYFCAILESALEQPLAATQQPASSSDTGFIKIKNVQSEIGLSPKEIVLMPGGQIGHFYLVYVGPQDIKLINSIKPDWTNLIHYGTFDFISQILLQVLGFLYRIVKNWGWAVVLLSLLIYFLLYPLTLKQMRSMKEMQALQPRIEEVRRAHKDNPQKMNKEIMELYREHKVNPFGGCLPLILQLPVFFALYQALMRSVVLRGAKFLWIKDLSEPDRLFLLPISLPILGNEINILPIVMAIGMFFQQKISMATTTTSQAEQQKIMLVLFPVMFGFIFYKMPSALVLYWFINSTLMLLYQLRIKQAK